MYIYKINSAKYYSRYCFDTRCGNAKISGVVDPLFLFVAENVRCFCNLPQCVTTGYMCKSSGGVCFSDLQDHPHPRSTVYGGRHGCAELLPNK